MSSLQRFAENGIEVYVDNATGESFTTVGGYARMSGKAKSTISERLKGVRGNAGEDAKIPTAGGLQGVRLIDEDLLSEWLPKDNPEATTKLLKLGVRKFLHQVAGYEHKPNADLSSQHLSTSNASSGDLKIEDTLLLLGALKSSLMNCGISPALAEGVFINGIAYHYPAIAPQVNESHRLMAAHTPSELLLTPSSIGERIGLTARKVNILLLDQGYQRKNFGAKKGEPAYLPTEKGLPYASNTIATGKVGDDSSYQHLKWKESIITALSSAIA